MQKYLAHETWHWLRDCRCFWMRSSVHFHSLLQPFLKLEISDDGWILNMAYCSLSSVRNWKCAAYRGTSHVPAVDNDAGKEDTANRCGITMYAYWRKTTGCDFHANKMTENCRLGYNNLSSGGPDEDLAKWKMTPKILVQTHTTSTMRPSRIWNRSNTVKYRETLDASPERGVWDYPPRVAKKLSYLTSILATYIRAMTQYEIYSGSFCDNRSYMSTLGELCKLQCRESKQD